MWSPSCKFIDSFNGFRACKKFSRSSVVPYRFRYTRWALVWPLTIWTFSIHRVEAPLNLSEFPNLISHCREDRADSAYQADCDIFCVGVAYCMAKFKVCHRFRNRIEQVLSQNFYWVSSPPWLFERLEELFKFKDGSWLHILLFFMKFRLKKCISAQLVQMCITLRHHIFFTSMPIAYPRTENFG